MKSLLRFLLFVLFLALAVGVLYFWEARSAAKQSSMLKGGMAALEEIDREFTQLVGRALPTVVSLNAIPADAVNPRLQLLRGLFGMETASPQLGAGVLVSKEGHIVTNYHVVANAGAVEVSLQDGRVLPAKFLGGDSSLDIAILKIDATNLQPIAWGNSDNVQVGQMVFAVGNPFGLQETVTQGIISAKGRRAVSEAANEFFQTDAAINRGNSGGPLVNLRGELIGINNMVPLQQAQGIAFAIPSNTVRRVFESIRDHGRFIRPWFGALMLPITPQLATQLGLVDSQGAVVVETYPSSPAEQAGLKPGDVVLDFNGRPIHDHIDLRNRMVEATIGDTVTLKIRRGRSLMDIKVPIAPEPGT